MTHPPNIGHMLDEVFARPHDATRGDDEAAAIEARDVLSPAFCDFRDVVLRRRGRASLEELRRVRTAVRCLDKLLGDTIAERENAPPRSRTR
ncbi:hypothetical protein [Salinarimonas chemoclinalis]|uniref:hypothetical protein n=1 Tax=Salinarimonas chemoclinalis TaxID=3241599 RepID=UPI003557D741